MYDNKGVKVISRILTTNEFQCEFGDNIYKKSFKVHLYLLYSVADMVLH